MRKALRSDQNATLLSLLREARKAAGLSQETVAKRLDKPQSFVAKYEGGERRLDVVEFVAVCQAAEADPINILAQLVGPAGTRPRSSGRKGRA